MGAVLFDDNLQAPPAPAHEGTIMRRRDFLRVMAGSMTIMPYTVAAQTAGKTYRIGTLTVGPPIPPTEGTGKMLVEGLAAVDTDWEKTSPMKRVVRREKSRRCQT